MTMEFLVLANFGKAGIALLIATIPFVIFCQVLYFVLCKFTKLSDEKSVLISGLATAVLVAGAITLLIMAGNGN